MLMEVYKINVIFFPAITIFILQPMDQGVILTLKFYDLGNIGYKIITGKNVNSSDKSGQNS